MGRSFFVGLLPGARRGAEELGDAEREGRGDGRLGPRMARSSRMGAGGQGWGECLVGDCVRCCLGLRLIVGRLGCFRGLMGEGFGV